MAQVRQLGPRVGSHLVLFCIHRVNWVNSRDDSESRRQHHKHCPGYNNNNNNIIIIFTVVVAAGIHAGCEEECCRYGTAR